MSATSPPSTHDYLPNLVANGACLYLPPSVLSVPIPLIDLRFVSDRSFVWATIQTPFGSGKPLFGIVRYASQERLEHGSAFASPDGNRLCIIVDVRVLAVPDYTRDKLIAKAQEHTQRLRQDEAYNTLWDQHFIEGEAFCIETGQ